MHGAPLFAAMLTPHRSMSHEALRWVIVFASAMAAIPGLVFFAMGAWPVVGLLGLDVLVLYWALSASLRGRDAFEEITLWNDALDIRNVSEKGRETLVSMNPFYARLAIERDAEGGIRALRIVSRDRQAEIARFLAPDDKARFAKAFSAALYKAKH